MAEENKLTKELLKDIDDIVIYTLTSNGDY